MRIRWRQPGQVGDDNSPHGVGNGPPTVDGERVGSREIQIADSPQVGLREGQVHVASSAVGPSLRQSQVRRNRARRSVHMVLDTVFVLLFGQSIRSHYRAAAGWDGRRIASET
jgi:hypothetical protein